MTSTRPACIGHSAAQACTALLAFYIGLPMGHALAQSQEAQEAQGKGSGKALGEVVISASRAEQRRFDAPGAIDAVQVDAAARPAGTALWKCSRRRAASVHQRAASDA